jgi:predicted hydrocarbon binding protein
MAYPIELAPQHLMALPRASWSTLRASLLRDAGAGYAGYLQEAGFAGGATVYGAFQDWLAARGAESVAGLSLEAFGGQLAAFFAETGWGSLSVTPMADVVAAFDASDWAEADPDAGLDHAACHWTTGMLADVLGRLAGSPLAVLEVECRSAGSARCRWLVGSPEVMGHVYEQMSAGQSYEAAIEALA